MVKGVHSLCEVNLFDFRLSVGLPLFYHQKRMNDERKDVQGTVRGYVVGEKKSRGGGFGYLLLPDSL